MRRPFGTEVARPDPIRHIVARVRPSIVSFWLDRGINGFRVDAGPYLFEREGTNYENLPETHAFCKELRSHADQFYPGTPATSPTPERAIPYHARLSNGE